jgi:hypothetical protein
MEINSKFEIIKTLKNLVVYCKKKTKWILRNKLYIYGSFWTDAGKDPMLLFCEQGNQQSCSLKITDT